MTGKLSKLDEINVPKCYPDKKKYNMNLVKYKDIQTIIFHLDEIIYKYQHS